MHVNLIDIHHPLVALLQENLIIPLHEHMIVEIQYLPVQVMQAHRLIEAQQRINLRLHNEQQILHKDLVVQQPYVQHNLHVLQVHKLVKEFLFNVHHLRLLDKVVLLHQEHLDLIMVHVHLVV